MMEMKDSQAYSREDSGCAFATEQIGHQSNCLHCPFMRCIYDKPGARRRFTKDERDEEIRKLRKEGKLPEELAALYRVGIRTIQRALRREG
ncbi:hypothetical protein LCGC14_0431160 [marine sediment metagenome]|uniref:Resolvase HTH domain-containing protein n=1 Tax=marine sediment metagenome TaxID=412755 RepID=A0A0F9VA53_9ZZZZ